MRDVSPDGEFHDVRGNHFILLGQRLLCNHQVVRSRENCPVVKKCRLHGNCLVVEFDNGTREFPNVFKGPPR